MKSLYTLVLTLLPMALIAYPGQQAAPAQQFVMAKPQTPTTMASPFNNQQPKQAQSKSTMNIYAPTQSQSTTISDHANLRQIQPSMQTVPSQANRSMNPGPAQRYSQWHTREQDLNQQPARVNGYVQQPVVNTSQLQRPTQRYSHWHTREQDLNQQPPRVSGYVQQPAVNASQLQRPTQRYSQWQTRSHEMNQQHQAAFAQQAPANQANQIGHTRNAVGYDEKAKSQWFKSCISAVTENRVTAYAHEFCQCGWNHISGGELPAKLLSSNNAQDIKQANVALKVISQQCLVSVMAKLKK